MIGRNTYIGYFNGSERNEVLAAEAHSTKHRVRIFFERGDLTFGELLDPTFLCRRMSLLYSCVDGVAFAVNITKNTEG